MPHLEEQTHRGTRGPGCGTPSTQEAVRETTASVFMWATGRAWRRNASRTGQETPKCEPAAEPVGPHDGPPGRRGRGLPPSICAFPRRSGPGANWQRGPRRGEATALPVPRDKGSLYSGRADSCPRATSIYKMFVILLTVGTVEGKLTFLDREGAHSTGLLPSLCINSSVAG